MLVDTREGVSPNPKSKSLDLRGSQSLPTQKREVADYGLTPRTPVATREEREEVTV